LNEQDMSVSPSGDAGKTDFAESGPGYEPFHF